MQREPIHLAVLVIFNHLFAHFTEHIVYDVAAMLMRHQEQQRNLQQQLQQQQQQLQQTQNAAIMVIISRFTMLFSNKMNEPVSWYTNTKVVTGDESDKHLEARDLRNSCLMFLFFEALLQQFDY